MLAHKMTVVHEVRPVASKEFIVALKARGFSAPLLTISEVKKAFAITGLSITDDDAILCMDSIRNLYSGEKGEDFENWFSAPPASLEWSEDSGPAELLRLQLQASYLATETHQVLKNVHKVQEEGLFHPSVKYYKSSLLRSSDSSVRIFDNDTVTAATNELGHKTKYKKLLLIRHGQSESNPYDNDPFFFDPGLTPLGLSQVERIANWVQSYPSQLVLVSPLRRALISAECVLNKHIPKRKKLVHPLLTEVITAADDIGSLKLSLVAEFPNWSWNLIHDQYWWWIPEEFATQAAWPRLPKLQQLFRQNPWEEPIPHAYERLELFENSVARMKKTEIIAVGHGDFFWGLTGGIDLKNAGYVIIRLDPHDPSDIRILLTPLRPATLG